MLFRTSCGHVTRHRNSRVRREADAACKPLRRGYKVVTAICRKSSNNFTKTPKKCRFFLFCTSGGGSAGRKEWLPERRENRRGVMWAPGERSGSRARREDGAGSCGTKQETVRMTREPDGTMQKPSGAGSCWSRTGRRGSRTEHVQAGEGAAERSAAEISAGTFSAERGVLGGK